MNCSGMIGLFTCRSEIARWRWACLLPRAATVYLNMYDSITEISQQLHSAKLYSHTTESSASESFQSKRQDESRWQSVIMATSAVLCGSFTVTSLVALRYFYKKRQKDSETFPSARYRDPLIDRTGHLILYKDTWLPEFLFSSEKQFNEIRDFSIRDNDIIIASFPKSGTTWVQEIVYQLILLVPSLSFSRTQSNLNMEEKFPYLEYIYPGLKEISRQQSPRLIKTHLPYHLLPSDVHEGRGKVIYIVRNAKDVCVSYYHFVHSLTFLHYRGDFNHFFDSFVNGTVSSGPWPDHVTMYWLNKDNENMLFISYEELHQNPAVIVRQIAEFLGINSLTDHQVDQVVNSTSFKTMSENPLTNYSWWKDLGLVQCHQGVQQGSHGGPESKPHETTSSKFLRKGEVGDWENHMTTDMCDRMEAVCFQPIRDNGITF